ncbi:hypothetical protein A9Q87_06475 [Flavobacteriales bacterium 34_180_T64]|nr:hypothetical protein A9Q87_06475 [Flavobacteriales bacterium 34_180_T64]
MKKEYYALLVCGTSFSPCNSKFRLAVLFMLVFSFNLLSQVTFFSEDFEAATGNENQTTPYLGWQTGDFPTTPPTNNNYWWVLDNTRCSVISGNYSMAVSINSPVTTGIMPQYRSNRAASTLVYYATPIDASNYTSVTLDFNWICEGEVLFDYGTVLYSLDGTTWATLPGFYEGQSTVQSVTNLDLSILDGQIFYLGFGWDNDNSISGFPSFIVDDIDVNGIALTPCTSPNQPTVLNLTPSGDTINGSFTAAIPAPDNYLVVVSASPVAPTPVSGTSYNIGDPIGTGTVVDIDTDTTFTATGLNPSTLYYIYVYAYNSICSGGPLYNTANPLSGSTTTTNSVYCTPSNELVIYNTTVKYIDDVEFRGTLNDVTNINNGNSVAGYTDYTGLTNCIQAQGEGINVIVGGYNGRGRWKAWVDWDKDDVFNLATEEVYDSGGIGTTTTTFGFGIPANQTVGDYRIRIRFHNTATDNWSYDFNACEFFDFWDDATGNPNDGDFRLGEAEDYLFTVVQSCDAKITSILDGAICGPGAATLQVTGSSGTTQFNWYDAKTGGNLVASTTSGSWSPIISGTTTYWVTAFNGTCESLVRTKIVATLNPITTLTISPASPTVCGEDDIIEITATGDTEIAYLIDEDFESGGLGVFTNVNNDANNAAIDAAAEWQNRTSIFVPSLPEYYVWFPAISSGFGVNQFALATSDVAPSYFIDNSLLSPVLDSSTFTDLTLSFDMYFSKYLVGVTEDVNIEVSTNGGTTWTTIQTYSDDVGYGSNFTNVSFNLTAYVNQANLRLRINYYAAWCDGVAVDNIQLYGSRPLSPSFTWTGTVDAYTDLAATIPYVPGTAISTVYVKPTFTQLEQASFTFTANATLSNGCTINKDITITNNSKIWQGFSTDWNDINNWKPSGVPSSSNCVIIPNTTFMAIISNTTSANAYNLKVLNGGILEIQPEGRLTVQDIVNVVTGGTFDLLGFEYDTGSLIQVNNVANLGNISMRRDTNVRRQDYVYWSSPVVNFPLTSVSPTTPAGLIYEWNPTAVRPPGPPPDFVPNDFGEWISASGNMVDAKGYIIRGPNAFDNETPAWYSASFLGTPNNGDINIGINRGTFTGTSYNFVPGEQVTSDDDNWNLVGNPYPSTLDADAFLALNTTIDGTVYLWTHGSRIALGSENSPFYGTYLYNYNISDYLEYNSSGSNPPGFDGYIGSGQGFFVLMEEAPNAGTNETLTFNNSMRSSAHENDQFFRSDNDNTSVIHKDRIWLDLVSPEGITSTTLVAYVEGATNQDDRLYDASTIGGTGKNLYSVLANEEYIIQGRQHPLDSNDQVPLGMSIEELGEYTIAINTIEGIFTDDNQNIYIEDLLQGVTHDIKAAPYFFTMNTLGDYNDRFVLRYTDATLGLNDVNNPQGLTIIAPNGEYVKVNSQNEMIDAVFMYDLLGRVLVDKKDVNDFEFIISQNAFSNGTYIVKATLKNGKRKIQKIILK